MERLCYSANKESEDAYDVSTSLTGYEPNDMVFSELNDSSGSFSFMNPSSDQDMDDLTLGKLLTPAHRGQVDYCEPEGVSVSQSSSSVVFDGSGKPDERNSSNALIRTLLEEQRQTGRRQVKELRLPLTRHRHVSRQKDRSWCLRGAKRWYPPMLVRRYEPWIELVASAGQCCMAPAQG